MNFTSLFISFFLNSFIVWMKRLALPNEREPNLSKVYFDYDSVVVCLFHYSYRDCEIVFIIRRLFWFLLIKSSLLDCPPPPPQFNLLTLSTSATLTSHRSPDFVCWHSTIYNTGVFLHLFYGAFTDVVLCNKMNWFLKNQTVAFKLMWSFAKTHPTVKQ